MRIVIDMQGAQDGNRFRGIGRYTMGLVKAMAKIRGEHEVVLALNAAFPDTIDPIRAAFANLVPSANIRVWEAPGPVGGHDSANDPRRLAAEALREAFLASLEPDVILVPSLFEEYSSDGVTSLGRLETGLPTAVILHDLIPLIHKDIYLTNPVFERWYRGKLEHLKRADLLLSNSESSGREAVEWLNFPEERVVNISSAVEDFFKPRVVTEADREHLRKAYGITRAFVLYTGGIDHRKNVEGLIRAFAQLPKKMRWAYQLVVVCAIHEPDRLRLSTLASEHGLKENELVITGYVPEDDLIILYNSCTLLAFSSWHEGFGLPVLEAMACGRAAIAADCSSLPEVVGNKDALFAPRDDDALAAKMAEVLGNPAFRTQLERHGLEQAKKFSWEASARRAWSALEALAAEHKNARQRAFAKPEIPAQRPRLAYISPLPPEQTGIADYSAELIPVLSRYYDITVIVDQKKVLGLPPGVAVHDAAWFRARAHRFDRVLYHFGNSPFHTYMFDLLADLPGVVVLHDFFLSGIVAHHEVHEHRGQVWSQALLRGHGWSAVKERFTAADTGTVVLAYPCNLEVLQRALGVIVHSDFSRRLAQRFYGTPVDWAVLPLLRAPVQGWNKDAARRKLGLNAEDFIVCSFGLLGFTKLNQRLLDAWKASALARDSRCRLVFVGENDGGNYGQGLLRTMAQGPGKDRVSITGWASAEAFRDWLAAADVAVQLRSQSRGETSGTVLDCLNYGLATLTNAHGSMAELPRNAVWMLEDEFQDQELIAALEALWRDPERRKALGGAGQSYLREHHDPDSCAQRYFEAIEGSYAQAQQGLPGVFGAVARQKPPLQDAGLPNLAKALAANFPPKIRRHQLLLDISELVQRDVKSGIQRVTRALLQEIALNPPTGWQVEPVYATTEAPGYRYARGFMCRFLGIAEGWAEDAPVDAWPGDVFFGLDLQQHVVAAQENFLQAWRGRGVRVFFVVYDLLPVLLPETFPEGAQGYHQRWLSAISRFDGAVTISRAVAEELFEWVRTSGAERELPYALHWFHLGSDVDQSAPSRGLPADAPEVLSKLSQRPTFLTVGTIESRKGHAQTLAAFDQLWGQGVDVNWVIVGKQGWMVEPLIERLRSHPEKGARLFWLEGISDEYLEEVYAAGTCLVAASYGEGFGLPLIEAARHGLPLLVRDIPVFREVTAGRAYFFPDSRDHGVIARAVQEWLSLYKLGRHPRSETMPHQSWKDSARQVLDAVLGRVEPYKVWKG